MLFPGPYLDHFGGKVGHRTSSTILPNFCTDIYIIYTETWHKYAAQVRKLSQRDTGTNNKKTSASASLSFKKRFLLFSKSAKDRSSLSIATHCDALRLIASHCKSLRVIAGQQMASTCLSRRPSSLRFLLMFILFDQLLVIEMYRSAQEIQIDPKSKLNEYKQYKV